MFCIRCQNDVYYCTCPDIEERLRAIASHPNWAIAMCNKCKKPMSRCDCPDVGETPSVSL